MTLPDRDVAVAWVGRTVVDRDGTEIGACTAVYADDATELAEWVCSELAGVAVLLPAVGAAESDGQVRVLVSRADIAGAPAVDAERHVSAEEEQALYRHYGIPFSREASPSVLPTDEPDPAAAGSPDTTYSESGPDSLAASSGPDSRASSSGPGLPGQLVRPGVAGHLDQRIGHVGDRTGHVGHRAVGALGR